MVIFNKLPTYYADGTATVAANGTTVTGTGTVWTNLQPGDLFGVHKGLAVPIADVVSATELTLLFPWPGAAQTDADYCVQFIPRSVGVQEATRQLLLMLANGNLDAFAALLGGTDKIPMFTGPGTLTVVNKSELVSGVQADKQVATLADRATYDNSPTDFKVLVSNTGDGRAALYTKLSNATADWSAPAYITGPIGADGVNPRGFYDNGTAYAVDDLVYSGGSTWIAKTATTGNAPPTLPTTENTQWLLFARAGAAMNPRGDYAAGTAYEPLDTVLNGGSSWVAKIPTTGNAPPTLPTTSNTQWQLLAQKGNDGTGTGDVVGPDGGVAVNDLAVFANTTGKLLKKAPNNVVGNALLSQIAAPAIKGRLTAGTGDVEDLTPAQANQLLGGWEPIGLISLAAQTGAVITDLSAFVIVKISFFYVISSDFMSLQVSTNNGSTFANTGYRYNLMQNVYNGTSNNINTDTNNNNSSFAMGQDTTAGEITIHSFNKAINSAALSMHNIKTSTTTTTRIIHQEYQSAVALNALRLQNTGVGTITGRFFIEGIRG